MNEKKYGWCCDGITGFMTLDRESIASPRLDINRNPWMSKWISIKAWIFED